VIRFMTWFRIAPTATPISKPAFPRCDKAAVLVNYVNGAVDYTITDIVINSGDTCSVGAS
jgi:hypothetical protein